MSGADTLVKGKARIQFGASRVSRVDTLMKARIQFRASRVSGVDTLVKGTHTVWGVTGESGRYPHEGRAYSLGRHGLVGQISS